MSTTVAAPVRRADLDWIRVSALGLLIVYHVLLVYAPWDWHLHSQVHSAWVGHAALITNPWRLTLLFLVSGCAVGFMSRRRSAREVVAQRAARLLPPLAFGVVVLVPPQSWLEALSKNWFSGSLDQWWLKEFGPAGLSNGVPVNHLWFLVYIIAYSAVAVALLAQPRLMARLREELAARLCGWRLLVLPVAYLALARVLVFPFIGVTNSLSHDWYNHLASLGAFLFGFLLAERDAVWRDFERFRRLSLAVALVALAGLVAFELHPGRDAFYGVFRRTTFAIDQWATIAAVLGYGSRYLRRADGPVLRYLNEAIFPCYLAHQTLLVIAAYLILGRGLAAPVEGLVLVLITLGGSLLVYEIVRRIGILRPLWGLKRRPATEAYRPTAPAPRPAEAA